MQGYPVIVVLAALLMAGAPSVGAVKATTHVVQVDGLAATTALVRAERRRGVRIVRVYRHAITGFAARLRPGDVRRLRRAPRVVRVEPARPFRPSSEAVRLVTSTGLWGLDRIDQRGLPLDGRIITDGVGTGARVYVVDSGIRSAQQQFTGRLLPGFSSVGDGRGTEDCHGHGTRVSGVIGGAVTGVAPGAWLVPVRVVDCAGNGNTATLLAGLDWVVASHRSGNPAVANISLVGPQSLVANDAVQTVVDDGVAVAAAAGNSPVDACTTSPGSAPGAITAAAMAQQGVAAPFSAWGPCVDLYAPGEVVLTTATVSRPGRRANQLVFASGTSISAGFVSGAAALALAQGRGPDPGAIARWLVDGATPDAVQAVPPGTPNRLLYVGVAGVPAPQAIDQGSPRVFSRTSARFLAPSGSTKRVARYRLAGTTALPGVLTTTRAGKLLSRRYVRAGSFAFRTRKAARRISVLRMQLRPDDPRRTVASVLVRVRGG